MGLFGKKEVPDELPSLAIDEVNKNVSATVSVAAPVTPAVPEPQYKALPKQSVQQSPEVKNSLSQFSPEDEKGYFKELVKSVTEDNDDVGKLETWYRNEFLPRDMVFQMREYWQKQQPEILLKNVSGELKQKLMEKTERLHMLEKDWQEIYFNLLSKEEEIRKEEKELKGTLSEFMSLVKSTTGKSEKDDKVRKK